MATLPYVPSLGPDNNYIKKPNFPLPPTSGNFNTVFPSDLNTSIGGNNKGFFTQLQFVKYQRLSVFEAPFLLPYGGISLPLPKKINDAQTVIWEAVEGGVVGATIESLTEESQGIITAGQAATNIAVASGGAVGGAVSNFANFNTAKGAAVSAVLGGVTNPSNIAIGLGAVGIAVNPFLTMLFKNGNFKEHTLQWTFTPNNENESNIIASIVNYFKFNMLPAYNGAFLNYPNLLLIKLYPDDTFTFQFKPCAISAVSVDYSGGGGPSFFTNGAPTVINLALQLKEIELWTQNDYSIGI